MKQQITDFFKILQDDICQKIEAADGKGKFRQDLWERDGGGGGRTRIIEGQHIEKGGVNFSAVQGALPEKIAKALNLEEGNFYATGVSIVLHPKSPMVPIIHMNVRYFEVETKNDEPQTWWFGGGIDLTPHYVVEEDAQFFHRHLKSVCDQHHKDYFPKFKTWADDYFYVRHRKETRGVGGIFFDRLSGQDGFSKEQRFDFVKDVGEAFCPIYTYLLKKNKNLEFGEEEKKWQYLRRGRYVEFNLVWDKGTKFGLDTDGRTESILMSLPPTVQWVYDHQTKPGSREEKTLQLLKKGIDWT
ncbi:oxygen-dependent coproporphyrinogen oxidase [Saprospiraceae bacterium]|jgi:coproporphyrinogen III oxidase|nr:oxygen-dependent coproporphyrinogen oxidase [Bacteroidota bacterium]MDB4728604.1 oxygen-dependent coproporphyrinogen oxidase [Saprospiraceae bacterium]MDF1866529.1 oxygen-dependent coproporphyrinogen oxidase [Saprospiraceae bacterium]